jgi:hypothetical protein
MDSISTLSGAPGLAQVYLLRKTMDLALAEMASMLQVLPQVAPIVDGRLDTYA